MAPFRIPAQFSEGETEPYFPRRSPLAASIVSSPLVRRVFSISLLLCVLPGSRISVWGQVRTVNPKIVSVPITFEKNVGQAPPSYQFLLRDSNVEALFSSKGVDLVLAGGDNRHTQIRLRWQGSRSGVIPEGRNLLPTVSNYLMGPDPSRWIHGVPNDSRVVYREIYPGIELVFHGTGEELEHDFRVAPGADPKQVKFSIEGTQGTVLDASGNLDISLPSGRLTLRKPTAYQKTAHGQATIESVFVINHDHTVQFQLGAYDHHRELVIDPVFVFSTYLAGSNADYATAVTTDTAGNIYLTGYTYSLDFPVENGVQPARSGSPSAFVSKLDPTGHTLLYSTYLGGSSRNYGNAVAIDSNENIIVAGTSSSTDFPHAGSVPVSPPSCVGNQDCYFLVSLKPDGSAFNYAGRIGGIEGTAVDTGESGSGSLALDAAGNAYLTSVTDDADFELTAGTLATTVPGYPYNSTFVVKVSPTGALLYSTIIPGTAAASDTIYLNNVFIPAGISVDANGQVTIAGTAGQGLPSTAGVVQATFPNSTSVENPSAGFVLQLNAAASAINYATYVPGTDTIGGFAVDKVGDTYVTGGTSETNLPVSSNAYQKTMKAGPNCTCNSGFILELNGTGTSVLAATYLEGTPGINGGTDFTGMAVDSNSNIYVGGMTASTDFPMMDSFIGLWVSGNSALDMVVAEMKPDLSSLLFGSFLSSTDQVFAASTFSAITVDNQDHPIVVGQTATTDFPTTPGSFQPTPPTQAYHGFIAKLDMATAAPSVCFDSWNVNFGSVNAQQSSTQTVHLTNCGNAPLSVTSQISSAQTVTVQDSCGTVQPGAACAISLTYTPIDNSGLVGTLTFTDNAVISPQVVQLSGQGVAPHLSPSTGSFDFGHLLVNTSGAGNQFVFQNTGNAPLSITGASVLGDFSITQNGCVQTLQANSPNSFCMITIAFSPTAGGIRTGTLTIASNDPVYPQAGLSLVGIGDTVYAVPVISSLGSPTALINNGTVTVQAYGANFYPASVISVNGVAQPTTYSGQQQLQATLTSGVSSAIGEASLAVSNPAPGGGTSVAVPLTLYEQISVDAAFLTSVPGSSLIYASVPSSSATNPNTVIPINPATGAIGTPIPVGNNPGVLAPSSDGSYLFVVANQDQTVQRIDLATNAVEKTFAFPPNGITCCGAAAGTDLKGIPGSPQEVVLATNIPEYGYGEMALYNDSGLVNYAPIETPSTVLPPAFTSFAYAGNPLTIYALPFTIVQNSFFSIVTIGAQGLGYTPLTGGNYGGNNKTGATVVSDETLLYTSAGEVWNPATQTQTGTFPVTTYNDTSYPNFYSLIFDASSSHLFLIGVQNYGDDSSALVLSAYGQQSLALSGALAFPQFSVTSANSLIRWGTNGFAFLAQNVAGNNGAVFVLTSSMAASVASNPVPQVASLTPSSLPQGSSVFQLTINGQGFTAGSVVMWNGSALPTTYTASTALTALVPATDLAQSGSASVTVSNPTPGGGNSSPASFTILPLTPLLSFSSSSIVFPNQAAGTSSTAQTIAVQNPGTATLNISGVQIMGANVASFQQTNNCGNSLIPGGNCSISLVFAPAAAGAQTASLAVSDNASGSPQSVMLSGMTPGVGLTSPPSGSTTATVTAGATATYNLLVGGAGLSGVATITCTGAPTDAVCSVPTPVTLNATTASPLTVTVTTTARTSAAYIPSLMPRFWAIWVFGLLVVPTVRRMGSASKWIKGLPFLLLILVCSCGGGGGGSGTTTTPPASGTPAGQFTLTVTVSAGSSSQSLPLNLVVQ
jgi:hypothetical protein